jgi:hypothetical protein
MILMLRDTQNLLSQFPFPIISSRGQQHHRSALLYHHLLTTTAEIKDTTQPRSETPITSSPIQ